MSDIEKKKTRLLMYLSEVLSKWEAGPVEDGYGTWYEDEVAVQVIFGDGDVYEWTGYKWNRREI